MFTFLRVAARALNVKRYLPISGDLPMSERYLVLERCSQQKRKRYIRPMLEVLEDRVCPTTYNYNVIAQTGQTVDLPNSSTAASTLFNDPLYRALFRLACPVCKPTLAFLRRGGSYRAMPTQDIHLR
jgi:hypothetical protein